MLRNEHIAPSPVRLNRDLNAIVIKPTYHVTYVRIGCALLGPSHGVTTQQRGDLSVILPAPYLKS